MDVFRNILHLPKYDYLRPDSLCLICGYTYDEHPQKMIELKAELKEHTSSPSRCNHIAERWENGLAQCFKCKQWF